jgi:hypothetical protein
VVCDGLVLDPLQKDAKLGHNSQVEPCVSRLAWYVFDLSVPSCIADHALVYSETRAPARRAMLKRIIYSQAIVIHIGGPRGNSSSVNLV